MSQSELLKKTALALARMEAPYMLTGSLASSLQGEPRSTHDIDIVVELAPSKIDALLAEFPPPEYYVDRTAMEQAIARRGMFNVIDVLQGDKVDFWILTDGDFDQSRFRRRVSIDFKGETIFVSAPEDTILMKLKWDDDSGGGGRQFRDALRVYELQQATLDESYLQRWITRLQLDETWQRLLAEAKPPT
ncbi:MAG TPA: hypothetical protein VGJ26_13765 [Pirellulales bacterium]|jgi:hypothetical protein